VGGYAIHVSLRELTLPVVQRMKLKGENAGRALAETLRQGRRRVMAQVIHLSFVVIVIAVAVSSTMGISREVILTRGESVDVGHYTLTFLGTEVKTEPNRMAVLARVGVARGGKAVATLVPHMNEYASQREPVGTPAVRSSVFEDLYLSVMNVDPNAQTLGLRVFVNPMVGWIWVAMIVMALAGFAAVPPTRKAL
jgi:cytochrome c-type biogenesis protein CcmF